VFNHEETLLSILEKIGQTVDSSIAPSAIEDATSNADHKETKAPPDPKLPGGSLSVLAPITKKNLYVHHDTHPIVFDIALLAKYDLDWILWEPQTLWHEIKGDFRVPSISDHTCAKIQALRTLHINEWFWTKWEVFCWITQALNNNIPDFVALQKPSIAQLFNAVEISDMVRSGEEFSPEVQHWVAACMVDEGVFYAPKPISFCQEPLIQVLKDSKIENGEAIIAAVQNRYREIIKIPKEDWAKYPTSIFTETTADIQTAKLKVANDYLILRQEQLKDQLRLLV
jgi:hypothetical protein